MHETSTHVDCLNLFTLYSILIQLFQTILAHSPGYLIAVHWIVPILLCIPVLLRSSLEFDRSAGVVAYLTSNDYKVRRAQMVNVLFIANLIAGCIPDDICSVIH